MATLPTDPAQLLLYLRTHGDVWVSNAGALGLSPQQVAELTDALAAADQAEAAAFAARLASVSATTLYYAAADRLYRASASVVRTARTTALNTGDEEVYALAQIDPPRNRRERAPLPAQPVSIRASLGTQGQITLTWKTSNARGVSNVVYQVLRRPGGQGEFTPIGNAGGTRTFTDDAVPAGVHSVQYQIVPFRGGRSGPASPVYTVQFGTVKAAGLTLRDAA